MLPSDVPDETKSTALKIVKAAEKETGSQILKPAERARYLFEAEEDVRATVTLEDVNDILQQPRLSSELVAYLRKFLKSEPLLPLLEFKTDELKRKKRTKVSFDDAKKELLQQESTHPSPQVSTVNTDIVQ